MLKSEYIFDELGFFAMLKKRPGVFLGEPSIRSLRDLLHGMEYAFSFCFNVKQLNYFDLFTQWYRDEIIRDSNGNACWWNHILYISGDNDVAAFDLFFLYFERYLSNTHNLCFPEII